MLIADQIRKVANVDKYIANSYDDETGRFVEELRIYEREVGNFQFKILDEDVIKCINNLPVELNGVDTDPVEVVGHRGMNRISTDRVRGGALRVMNDGLIGRSRKLLKLVEILKLDGWNWLNDLKGAIQTGDDDDAAHHRMSEVITGRPVLSMTKKIGGFRLRYGRCCNTGFATIGIHSVVPILLNHAIVVGTQIKMDVPGKASTIALVDTIEPPLVRLVDGSVVQVSTVDQATKIRSRVDKILYLGDILISYGDFLENNAQLLPASYVEEIWALQLHSKLLILSSSDFPMGEINNERLIQLSKDPFTILPTVEEAFEISKKFDIPLHPKYSFYWDSINIDEVLLLKEKLCIQKQQNPGFSSNKTSDTYLLSLDYDPNIKDILERLGVIHSVKNEEDTIEINSQDQSYSLTRLLLSSSQSVAIEDIDFTKRMSSSLSYATTTTNYNNSIKTIDVTEFISITSGIEVKRKFASSVAVRVGRPEKAAERKMKPPVHVLFPIGSKGGATRDILKAANNESFYTEISNRFCNNCKLPSVGIHCPIVKSLLLFAICVFFARSRF